MMKHKFKFNLSFLDRFKKSKTDVSEEIHQDESAEENFEEEGIDEHSVNKVHSEYDTSESPEDFAEKTLGGFDINKYKHQLEESETEEVVEDATEDNINESSDNSDDNFIYQEMELPGKPEVAKKFKFKFKFPSLNSDETKRKIKNSFANKSPLKTLDKLSWNDFILRLFSPYTRRKIHSVFVITLVITATYILGKSIALFLNKSPPIAKSSSLINIPLERTNSSVQDINKISSTNLFNIKESDKGQSSTAKVDIESIVCLDAEKQTTMQIKLLDTIVLQDSVKSVASVQIRGSSELMNVREGERVDNMLEISKINRMKVILKNLQTGDCEYASSDVEAEPAMPPLQIFSPQAGKALFKSTNPSIKNVGNSFKIKRTFRDSMINNMSEVLTQAKAIQITNPDGSLSFKMTEIMPGSIYSQLNIQENDIIDNINGKKIENLNELMGLLGKIKEIDQFQIGLKRNGMSENLEYGFE